MSTARSASVRLVAISAPPIFIRSPSLSRSAFSVTAKSADVPSVIWVRIVSSCSRVIPASCVALLMAPMAAPATPPTTGTKKSVPTSRPQRAPQPAPCFVSSCPWLVVGWSVPIGHRTTAWSSTFTTPSAAARSRAWAASVALSGSSNFHTVKLVMSRSRLVGRLITWGRHTPLKAANRLPRHEASPKTGEAIADARAFVALPSDHPKWVIGPGTDWPDAERREQRGRWPMTTHQDSLSTESTEIERLRAEVTRLQAEAADRERASTPPRSPGRSHSGLRWLGAGVLLVIVALLAPLAVVATWVHDEISDTDRYVQTVTPLASDPAVQQAVVTRVTNGIFTRLDVEAVTQQAVDALAAQGLPPRIANSLSSLSTPLANGVRSFIENGVGKLVRSNEFQQAWVAANREAHTQMVAVLTGKDTGTIQVSGDTVSVNLAAVIDAVKKRLEDAGFALASRIPEVNAQFTIVQSADIAKAQTGFRVLSALARTLPLAALLLFAAAIALAPARRKALVLGALAVAASMVLLGAALNGFRILYLDSIPPTMSQDAAAAVYDTLVGFIRLNLRAVLVLFLAVAAIAWATGPWAPAVAVRRTDRCDR